MQITIDVQFLGIILIIAGILLIIFGIIQLFSSSSLEASSHRKSKGIILIGPIPIVWGFGKRGKITVIVLFLIIILIWIIFFLI